MESKGKTDLLSEAELSSLVTVPELVSLTKEMATPDLLLLWLPEASAENLDIECGTAYRLKTEGNSPFICESLVLLLYPILSCVKVYYNQAKYACI